MLRLLEVLANLTVEEAGRLTGNTHLQAYSLQAGPNTPMAEVWPRLTPAVRNSLNCWDARRRGIV